MAVVAILLMWCLVFPREQFLHHCCSFVILMTYLKMFCLKLDCMQMMYCYCNTIHTKEDCLILQEDLNILQLWANKWQMIFNPDKCELIRITNTKLPIFYMTIIFSRKRSKYIASSVKYLGVYIDEHLTWKEHVSISKANASRTFL